MCLHIPGQVNHSSKKPHNKLIGERLGFACYPHALRRTFATLARHQCGADYQTVKRCLNHVNGDITDRYIQQEPESLRPTFQAVSDFFFRTVESGKPIVRMPLDRAKQATSVVVNDWTADTKTSHKPWAKVKAHREEISQRVAKNAAVIMGRVEQTIVEGKILASIRNRRDTKKDFYKKIGWIFR